MMTWHAPKLLGTLFALAMLTSCGEEPPPGPPPTFPFAVEVQVDDANQNPLPGVPVLLDGTTVGKTDANGKFSGTLTERPGATVTLSVGDIDGYKYPGQQPTEVTDTLRLTKVSNQNSGIPVFLRVQAESIRKDYFVWVHAKCDDSIPEGGCNDLPVSLNGEEVARTNEIGFAHFSFSDVPQNDVEITIDTPAHNPSEKDSTMFEPRDPSYKVALDLSSHVYVVDQTFSDPQAQKPKKSTKRRSNKRRRNKSSNRKKTQRKSKPSKPKDNGTIDLWD